MYFRGAAALFAAVCILGCKTPGKQPEVKRVYQVKVKYEDIRLQPAAEWIGGTETNPVYYTYRGERIETPLFGVDVVPVTRRSVDAAGKVIYPHVGLQLNGDMKLGHYIAIAEEVSKLDCKNKSFKPLIIYADSNFLERGAVVKSYEGTVIGRYEFKLLSWIRIK